MNTKRKVTYMKQGQIKVAVMTTERLLAFQEEDGIVVLGSVVIE